MDRYETPDDLPPALEEPMLPAEKPFAEGEMAPPRVNLNTATKTELIALPRIGRTLAQRIIEARPFGALEELAAIPGLSAAALEELRPLVTLGDAGETEPSAEAGRVRAAMDELEALEASLLEEDTGELGPPPEGWQAPEPPPAEAEEMPKPEASAEPEAIAASEQTPEPAAAVASEKAPEAAAPEPKPQMEAPAAAPSPRGGLSRGRVFGMVFLASLVTMLLSIVFTLAVLAALNGGLRYAAPVDVQRVARDVTATREQVQTVEQQLDGLRSRLDNMEALSGRVSNLEEQAGSLEGEIQTLDGSLQDLSTGLETLDGNLKALDEQMQVIQAEQGKYQTFFEKLTQTLNEVFGAPQENASPTPEGTAPPEPTPTPTETPAP
ncbi:MAG: hypothetical protein D6755_03425 [Anaerolineae bacterium]|nr:MAG: hypothetical protein D6755_03425 [Anaerolineae bacterium]